MPDLFWLLLPVAAFSGWLVGRRPEVHHEPAHGRGLNAQYLQGLNYVLNEQPDKAIEVFIKMVEVDSETVETHFALGNLFRRRGEVDRAIRIHQSLIARANLRAEERATALRELAEDYMRAGLFDRAENLFIELAESPSHSEAAYKQLLAIYEQEKDWEKAIGTAERLARTRGREIRDVIAHYFCELAEQAVRRGEIEAALPLIDRARSENDRCVRASILSGRLAVRDGDYETALDAYRAVAWQDIDFVPEVLGPLRQCYERTQGIDAYMVLLWEVMAHYDGVAPVLVLADVIREARGIDAAAEFLAEESRKRPSICGLSRFVDLRLAAEEGCEQGKALLVVQDIARRLDDGCGAYRCARCGFRARALHWNCPSCKRWSTIKPVKGLYGPV